MSEEAVDEISVSEENKNLAKSTWDSLDVQGSSFELLGKKPIVSGLGDQDVLKTQLDKSKQLVIGYQRKDKSEIKVDSKNIYINIHQKGNYPSNQKYKPVSSQVNADKNQNKRAGFDLKIKENDNVNENLSHPSQREKNNQYISSKISGNKGQSQSKQEIKYFSKNIVIQPVNIVTQTGQTQTNVQQYQIDYNNNYRRGMKGVSSGNKNLIPTIDILKEVKYFNKNIVIEPVNRRQGQIGKRETRERRPWGIDSKNEEDEFFGRFSENDEVINEDVLRNIPGIDENTKFFHKQIIITPVIIPPPRFIHH